jgi:hypothetical protein
MRHCSVTDGLEQTEKPDSLPVRREVKIVVNCRDASDYLGALPRKKELDRPVLVEGVLCSVDQLADVPP